MTFDEFKNNVQRWAAERGIYEHSTALAQCLKAVSELGELADHAIKGDRDAMKDDIGDIAVCLVNVAKLVEVDSDLIPVNNNDCMPTEVAVSSCSKTISDLCLMVGIYQSTGRVPVGVGSFEDLKGQMEYAFGHLLLISKELGHDFMDCCEHAWNEIKDRKGRMVAGGAFVKEGDEQKPDGGPVFPEAKGVCDVWMSEGGMTLRDYFAAKAMQPIISRMRSAQYNYAGAEDAAADAYAFADAMLKEREK